MRPYMESHGGGVEVLGLEDDVARLRLHGSCDGCPSSASTLELAIKQELEAAAPDLPGSRWRASSAPEVTGVPLPMAGGRRRGLRLGRARRT